METLSVKITSDLHNAKSSGQFSVLAFLDFQQHLTQLIILPQIFSYVASKTISRLSLPSLVAPSVSHAGSSSKCEPLRVFLGHFSSLALLASILIWL